MRIQKILLKNFYETDKFLQQKQTKYKNIISFKILQY